MPTNLFEVSAEYRALSLQLEEWADEHDGDVSGFEMLSKMNSLEEQIEKKVLNLACIVKELIADGKAVKDLGESLIKRGESKLNQAARIKEYINNSLPIGAVFEDTRAKVKRQKNGGKKTVLLMPEFLPKDLPLEFQKPPIIEANNDAIREAAYDIGDGKIGILFKGKVVAEVYQGEHLRIS